MIRLLCLLATLAGASPATAATPIQAFDPQARVTEAIAKVRPIAYNATTADWPAIERKARAIAATAKDTIDLLPAYAVITFGLADHHSFVQPTAAQRAGWTARYGERRLVPDQPPRREPVSAYRKRSMTARTVTTVAGGRVLSVVVPEVQWAEGDVSAPYGNALWAAVAAGAPSSCGFIVDLRGNSGGDMWPMVTGLSALIGDGHAFGSITRDGKPTMSARLTGAAAVPVPPSTCEPVINRITGWRALPALAAAPVAVLTDDGTNSSGEATTIAFRGRSNTRSFGQKTYSNASSNTVIDLSDGVRLFVTRAMMSDAAGGTYPDGVTPDVVIAPAAAPADDPVATAALAWLGGTAACRRRLSGG